MRTAKVSGTSSNILVIAIMLSGAFIAILNQTVLSPALPSIMRDLHINASEGQWLTTGFLLVNGIMIPITAYLTNKFTTRRLFIGSMLFFTVGSIFAAMAPNFAILMLGRLIQAVGAGVLMPLVQIVILLMFPKEKRGSALGMVGIVISAAPAIGPTLAGWLVDTWGWHMLFGIIAPIALLDIILAILFLRNVGETTNPSLDIVSVVYSTLGFGSLLYGCSSAGSNGWGNPLVILPLIIGCIFLVLFVQRQLTIATPLLELRVFKNSIFTYSTIIGMIVNGALLVGTIITPIYMQTILGYTALHSGLLLLPAALIMAIMSPITGKLFDRFGPRVLALAGLTFMTIGTLCFLTFDEHSSYLYLCLVYTFRMLGISMLMMPLTTWGINSLENRYIPHGNALNNSARQVAGSIGTAVLITIMTTTMHHTEKLGVVVSTLRGMHMAFGCAAALSAFALILAFFVVHDDEETKRRRAQIKEQRKTFSPQAVKQN